MLHERCRSRAIFAAFSQTAQKFSAFVFGSSFPTAFSYFSFPQEVEPALSVILGRLFIDF
jgi:hypothetical protein